MHFYENVAPWYYGTCVAQAICNSKCNFRNSTAVYFGIFMMQDTINEIRRMAEFLDIDLSEEQISTVREKTSCGAMKKSQEDETSHFAALRKSTNLIRRGRLAMQVTVCFGGLLITTLIYILLIINYFIFFLFVLILFKINHYCC